MPPLVATVLFVIGILGLFLLNRDAKVRTSLALWIPVTWLLIAGSRPVSAWLGGNFPNFEAPTSAQVLEGSPLDRNVFIVLLVLGILTLLTRLPRTGQLLRQNGILLLFLFYCCLSIGWSDFPDVAFKRWIKLLGDFVMVFVVLTESDPLGAVKRLFARAGFLLLPTSILLIKYYSALGRAYSPWEGRQFFTGVTDNKNSLGMIALLLGLAALWHFVDLWSHKSRSGRLRQLVAQGAIVSMALWLLWTADSVTSLSCFLMGVGLIFAANSRAATRKPWTVHAIVAVMLAVALSTLFLDAGGDVLGSMGRDSTLTGRTEIWSLVLGMKTNPIIGAGFESFWLGQRLQKIWNMYWWHPNQAHNGYLEIYLNLGWIGVIGLCCVLIRGYRQVGDTLRRDPVIGRLMLAFFVVAVSYNLTEAAFKPLNPVWITLLLAVLARPRIAAEQEPATEKSSREAVRESDLQVGALVETGRVSRMFELPQSKKAKLGNPA